MPFSIVRGIACFEGAPVGLECRGHQGKPVRLLPFSRCSLTHKDAPTTHRGKPSLPKAPVIQRLWIVGH